MKWIVLFLALPAQTVCAGLARYSSLVAADPAGASAQHDAIRVTYLGTNGYQFESEGQALLVDPYFSRLNFTRVVLGGHVQPDLQRIDDAMKRLSSKVNVIVVTHGHIDHLLDAPVIIRKTGARLVASRTAVELVTRAGAPAAHCDAITAGKTRRVGRWKITALQATHDRVFPVGVPFAGEPKGTGAPRTAADWVCGEPLSYLIETHGHRIFIDSGGTPSLLPPALGRIDLGILGVALPDSRARFSQAVRRLRPRFVLPSHQDDFFRPLKAGFSFGSFTNFPRVLRDHDSERLPGRLILLDYFRPWTLPAE